MRRPVVLLLLFCLWGCATFNRNGRQIPEVDWSLAELRIAITKVLPLGLDNTSPNGRELSSPPFLPDKNRYRAAGFVSDRYVAKITILGDRRPYDLDITVRREKRDPKDNQAPFKPVGYDMHLAQELERALRRELSKRREDRNFIDDFRVF